MNFLDVKFNQKEKSKYLFTRKYELINYSIENAKLIQYYIGVITIDLDPLAIKELTSKCNDTFLEFEIDIFKYARSKLCNIEIIYSENKIVIYGAPEYRLKLDHIISEYFSELQNDKITYSLKGKEDKSFLTTLFRKLSQRQIVALASYNEQGELQLEFRKKYFNIISEFLSKKKMNKTTKQIKSTRCEICLEKLDNAFNINYIKLKLCGHKFCIDCLKMQICNSLKMSSSNNIPIKCVKCSEIISNNDIFEIFAPNTPDYDFMIDKLISIFMVKNTSGLNKNSEGEYYWCPNKKEKCKYVYSSKIKEMGLTFMTCPNCECKICLLCKDLIDPNIIHNPDCQSKLSSKNSLSHFNSKENKCNNKLLDDEKPNNNYMLDEANNNSNEVKEKYNIDKNEFYIKDNSNISENIMYDKPKEKDEKIINKEYYNFSNINSKYSRNYNK